jgi:comEA protein
MQKLKELTGLSGKALIAIGFLLLTFSAGLILKYSGWKQPYEYDYSELDKGFESRIKSSFDELKQMQPDSQQQHRADELKALADSLGLQMDLQESKQQDLPPGVTVNINTSLTGDLVKLPGVGEVMAERIIEYREQNGKFMKPEDLMKVKGIGEKKFEKLKEHISVK